MPHESFDVGAWRRTALASDLTPAVKVLVVVLADAMNTRGQVSVPRSALAQRCGCSERQVSERFELAVRHRWLDRIHAGYPGRSALYVALRQTSECGRYSRAHSEEMRAVSPDAFVTVEPPAFSAPAERAEPVMRAVEPRASSKHTGTAAGRAACEPGTTEKRNDSGSPATPRLLRAVDVDGAA